MVARDEIDRQKVQDLFREYKRLTHERANQDEKVNQLTPAEREHYYDLIRRQDRVSVTDNRLRRRLPVLENPPPLPVYPS